MSSSSFHRSIVLSYSPVASVPLFFHFCLLPFYFLLSALAFHLLPCGRLAFGRLAFSVWPSAVCPAGVQRSAFVLLVVPSYHRSVVPSYHRSLISPVSSVIPSLQLLSSLQLLQSPLAPIPSSSHFCLLPFYFLLSALAFSLSSFALRAFGLSAVRRSAFSVCPAGV